jgi:ClpP class serine protease
MEGRRLGESELNELADGRVFIGSEAVSNGLVDFVTTWDDAISAVIKMTNEQIEKYIEDNPDSAPIGAIRADAYGRGLSDGAAQVRQTLAALAAEFPDDPGFALQQAGKGADVLSAKAAFADVLRARMSRRETPVQHVNPAEPQAALPLAAPTISVDADAGPDESDPKARAEWEWDHDGEARKSFSSKENYVGFRVAEMTGRLRVHVAR